MIQTPRVLPSSSEESGDVHAGHWRRHELRQKSLRSSDRHQTTTVLVKAPKPLHHQWPDRQEGLSSATESVTMGSTDPAGGDSRNLTVVP